MIKSGKLYVVGIGPGSYEDMTVRAAKALEESEIIIGYTVYVDLIREHFPHKEMLSTPMRREQERCRLAIDQAKKGKIAAMVCSGDSGVYGMSGLILEMARSEEGVEIEIIPGVTAALSGGAMLGAPLGHDFAVISLSDLLTPMELIEERLRASAQADMVICLYNPSSKKRAGYLKRACEILMEYKRQETVCGLVKNIGRKEEEMAVMTLEQLRDAQADMFSTVFIGNSMTKLLNGRMVTPRGYKNV
ncbi:precorrin-3B C(17)-methyltransferase [Lacrimispora saccharolytica]|uniref:Precorrin-3B C17-methyltransferase n=1 Tax=Lacrimispora saccharolytica (strain ATCC 35040 / DSM 2544 / NRCC 2533 / WM1) TaxID=610130 RepID=D9R4B4_LACSW|nr:precorrin-3B C(17)-methyltransferase [Lacrimispora saccharolytica]ADL04984.1 precorrin-3B C17-methyltransferase [[Clostridium] saccharolyticum WM1]QRV20814.1 precorrin-3B C(17)-methyltransferase [Lacrimispora saccharolytica]